MRGSIRKRGRTYTWYLFVPDPATGKPRQRSRGGYRTKRECQAGLNDTLAALRAGSFVETSRRTIGGFVRDEWLPVMELNLRPTTWTTYQGLLNAYVIPTLGAVELQRLTPGHLSVLYRELLTSGRRHRPGGLAPKTVRNVHVLLHRVLKDAVRWGYVVRNVADAADPPKVKPAELQVWSPGQLRAFLAHVQGDRQYAAWLLAATTGMRRGELLGLRWVDVDLDAARIAVRQPRVRAQNHQLQSLLAAPDTSVSARLRAEAALGAIWRPLIAEPPLDLTDPTHQHTLIDAAVATLPTSQPSPDGRLVAAAQSARTPSTRRK
jgi:Phage integrase, N-terminal SAM-like domain